MAQRLVRAKPKIRDAGIPYVVPEHEDLPERMPSVLLTIYLIFNEGYAATAFDAPSRRELCTEAIRLGRLLEREMPSEREVKGLLALMLLHDARRSGRTDEEGNLVLLPDQDRSLWDGERIREGAALAEASMAGPAGPYAIQAHIALEHARAPRADATDWRRIVALYDLLRVAQPSPVIELNRAVAVAMVEGPEAGLRAMDAIEGLEGYLHLHSARADMLARLGRNEESAAAYRRALELAGGSVERSFLEGRLAILGAGNP